VGLGETTALRAQNQFRDGSFSVFNIFESASSSDTWTAFVLQELDPDSGLAINRNS